MGDQDVEIRFKRVVFMDGTMAIVHRHEHITGDIPKVKLVMELSPFMVRFTKTNKKELVYDPNSPMSENSDGFIIREYDASSMATLSNNPEFPVIMMFCTFNGEPPNITTPNMAVVSEMVNTIKAKDSVIASKERTIAMKEKELDDMRSEKQKRQEILTAQQMIDIIMSKSSQGKGGMQ